MGLDLKIGIGINSGGGSKPNGNPSALLLTVLSDTSIKCDWTNGATNQDGTYIYYCTTIGGTYILGNTIVGNDTTGNLTDLTKDTLYYVKVVHYKGSKLSEYSSTTNETTWLAQANTLFSKSTTLTYERKGLINACFKSLNSAGFLNRLSALQLYAAHDESFALTDWIGSVTPSKISTPTFETDRGFTSVSGKAINSGFNPVRDGGTKFTSTRYSWGIYSRTNLQTASRDAGHANATTGTQLRLRTTADQSGYSAYYNTLTLLANTAGATTDSRGLFSISRGSDKRYDLLRNGVSLAHSSLALDVMVDLEMYVGQYNNNGVLGGATNRQYAFYYAGDYLTESESLEFFTIIETYLHAIGAGFFLT